MQEGGIGPRERSLSWKGGARTTLLFNFKRGAKADLGQDLLNVQEESMFRLAEITYF